MNAIDISGQAPGGQRVKLAERVPLDTPLVVQFHPVKLCNFRCKYCGFSMKLEDRPYLSDRTEIDFDLYKKGVDEMLLFPSRVKALKLAGMGEPLIYERVSDMMAYATDKNAADKTEIITNGFLLSHKMSDSLVAAGLSRLVISIQGTSAKKYQEVCGKKIDFEEFVSNIRYFYENRKKTHVYIKIIDIALDGKEGRDRFYSIFVDICDTIGIENAVPIHPGLEFNETLKNKGSRLTQFGMPLNSENVICPQPFFLMHVTPDGKVIPCCAFKYPLYVGDLNKQTLPEIWNSREFNAFRKSMLNGVRSCKVCEACDINTYRMFPEDDLSEAAGRLKKIYGEKGCDDKRYSSGI